MDTPTTTVRGHPPRFLDLSMATGWTTPRPEETMVMRALAANLDDLHCPTLCTPSTLLLFPLLRTIIIPRSPPQPNLAISVAKRTTPSLSRTASRPSASAPTRASSRCSTPRSKSRTSPQRKSDCGCPGSARCVRGPSRSGSRTSARASKHAPRLWTPP